MVGVVDRYLNRPVVLELLPAAVFFLVNLGWGFRAATVAVIVATLAVTVAGYVVARRVPLVALATLVIVLLLGGASLWFDDERFVKIKPTVGRCLFALALGVGLAFKPSFLERVLGGTLRLTDAGWRLLTLGWIGIALALAVVNELVWRNVPTDTWVTIDTILEPVSIVAYVLITQAVARVAWRPDS